MAGLLGMLASLNILLFDPDGRRGAFMHLCQIPSDCKEREARGGGKGELGWVRGYF